mgnify:CR=1 FL=1
MSELKDLVSGAEDRAHDAARSASREYAVARRNIHGALDDAMARIDDARKALQTGATDAAGATDDLVRRNPWQALGIVAVAALAVGYLLPRR